MRRAIFIRYRKIYDGWTKRNRESKKNFEKFMIDITHCARRILSNTKKYICIYINICKEYVLCKINVGYKNIIFYFSNLFFPITICICICVKKEKYVYR